jgi:uncharacterized protein YdhG (YjbR/CyaY superfamily)
MKMKKFATVDAYIKSFPRETQKLLIQIRGIIKKNAPKAEEAISYGMPGYKLYGKPLVYFSGYNTHIGFYPTPSAIIKFQKQLTEFKTGRGTVQLPLNKSLPVNLLCAMVQFRVKENIARASKKK